MTVKPLAAALLCAFALAACNKDKANKPNNPAPAPEKPAPAPAPKPEPAPQPQPQPEPAPQPKPNPTPAPQPVPEPQPAPAPQPQPEPQPTPSPSTDIPAPAGWVYYGGDEFNDNRADTKKWLVFGTERDGMKLNQSYGWPQGMIQTYRPEQLTFGNGIMKILSEKRTDGVQTNGQTGWWSGAVNSRDADVYYPLYSRIDIRAKFANVRGVWHAAWLTSYKGAETAELDIFENFVAEVGPNKATQSNHLFNNKTNKLQVNVPDKQNRTTRVNDIAGQFHVYSVVVERGKAANEAVITYMIDGKPTYSFATDRDGTGIYNKFITDAVAEGRQSRAWNVIITGQVGATNPSVSYPSENLDKAVSEIDYVRVFVKEEDKKANGL